MNEYKMKKKVNVVTEYGGEKDKERKKRRRKCTMFTHLSVCQTENL